jgi:hypothetical protein
MNNKIKKKNGILVRCKWLMPIISAIEETEIRRIKFWSQPGQIVSKTLSQKYPAQNSAGVVAQVVEHLPKCEALNSNPNTTKSKTNKQPQGFQYAVCMQTCASKIPICSLHADLCFKDNISFVFQTGSQFQGVCYIVIYYNLLIV